MFKTIGTFIVLAALALGIIPQNAFAEEKGVEAARAITLDNAQSVALEKHAMATESDMSYRDYVVSTTCDYCSSRASTLGECVDVSSVEVYLCETTIRDPWNPKPFKYETAGISGYVYYDECDGGGYGGSYFLSIEASQVEVGKDSLSVADYGIECTIDETAPWENAEFDYRNRVQYGDGYRYSGRTTGWNSRADTIGLEHNLGDQMYYVRGHLEHVQSKGSSGYAGNKTDGAKG